MTALPYSFARRHGVLVQDGERCLHRAGADPHALLEMQRRFGPLLAFESVADEAFDGAIAAQYRDSAAGGMDLSETDDLATLADSAAAVDDLLDSRDDSPVIKLINALLLQAVKDGASDIHVETQEKRLIVRFRVDGVLRDIVEPKRALAPLLVSRIKVMARLDIAEKRIPQDGRVTLRVGGYDIDVRVSTIPTQHGERVVMRLLDRGSSGLDLAALGMSEQDRETFGKLLDRPHGILLVTGPTGSGKTTTLYTALTHLNDRKRNIMTVEDPIEYELAGIGQTQVNAKTGMTFARGLRAILRQDPDVIMVGEIRDQETAEVAVRSSMTGHFVLSTLHTNSAIGSVTRLIDMGVERYLLAPMVVGLIAQRLVRRLCEHCRWQDRSTEADSILLGKALKPGKKVWRAQGCEHCHGEGYSGRLGLYEVVAADDELRRLIHDGASEAQLTAAARKLGPSLLEDGVAKLKAGLTTVEEVARVVQDEG
ncbi:type II secretion system ATPase GspE [Rhizorhabdus dicambivorans]|uniref:Type II secretion system protein E n=1 Tax=Rhizorhabdus dicambivorans TaxID=1850238 RepID=A0A2A4FTD5_9SPHN|nr:type II secretion system ATPase GspE [Rhizorhabdus dicambivorans]ATE63537.1 type II secretion system protein GspE [Rhizorhabdus dicambivorans]PCE41409.1 type II secretion system protein GspE [Rhizorhabdus dicambivorans]